ncbi:MAG: histidine phosphatase family protein [Actinomycetia bacterium]|nr:histidine phosphatase family protein [Actinomycetes bacterium]
MDILLIRHALPIRIENAPGGRADPDLDELGHRQAAMMAEWLADEPLDAIYVSPMARARQTAAPLEKVKGIEATVEHGVREWDFEDHTYIPMEELKAENPDAYRAMIKGEIKAERTDFINEVVESVERIVADHRGQRVAVVCHGGVVNAYIAAQVLGLEDTAFFMPHYTSISLVHAASTGERSVGALNGISHLRPLIRELEGRS